MPPMIYIDDAITGTIEFMEAPKETIKTKKTYNLIGVSIMPKDVANSIQLYTPDIRQSIADNRPKPINDSQARANWNWEHKFDLNAITN